MYRSPTYIFFIMTLLYIVYLKIEIVRCYHSEYVLPMCGDSQWWSYNWTMDQWIIVLGTKMILVIWQLHHSIFYQDWSYFPLHMPFSKLFWYLNITIPVCKNVFCNVYFLQRCYWAESFENSSVINSVFHSSKKSK